MSIEEPDEDDGETEPSSTPDPVGKIKELISLSIRFMPVICDTYNI